MKQSPQILSRAAAARGLFLTSVFLLSPIANLAQQGKLCLDGFCIGQTIQDAQFDRVAWITPTKNLTSEECRGVSCQPEVAFRGFSREDQLRLAGAVRLTYHAEIYSYSMLTKDNLAALRLYRYECNPSARGLWGERRFFGAYKSTPGQYLTVVGLRLINGELTVYRLARQYPWRNQGELVSLAKEVRAQYGEQVLLMKADTPDQKAIEAQIDRVVAERAELEKANARFLLDIRMQLKPDQWKQLQTLRMNRMHGMSGMGGANGRGEWGHGGQRPGMEEGQTVPRSGWTGWSGWTIPRSQGGQPRANAAP